MKVIELRGQFGIEHLAIIDRESPKPSAGQVLLHMRAVSLNYRDLLMVRGHYDPRQPLPLIPCSDGVGEVVALGEGVTRVQVGDRVCPIFAQAWRSGEPTPEKLRSTLGGPLDGTLCEEMVVSENSVAKVPSHLDDCEAATLPCAAVTAWSALVTLGQIKPGDTVLVQGTGGVSIFALQFAKLMGASVIATSSSDDKLERLKKLGADELINYKQVPDWGKAVRKYTQHGVDHIIEVGGANTLQQSLKAIRTGGHISLIGVLSGVNSNINILPILMQQIRIQGVLVGHRESFEAMNRAIEQHQLRPVIDKIFAWQKSDEAFQHLASGQHFGKVCIAIRRLATKNIP